MFNNNHYFAIEHGLSDRMQNACTGSKQMSVSSNALLTTPLMSLASKNATYAFTGLRQVDERT